MGRNSQVSESEQRVDVMFDKLDAFLERMESVADNLLIRLEAMEKKHE